MAVWIRRFETGTARNGKTGLNWPQLPGGAVALIAPFSAKQARRFATGVGRSGPKQNHTRRVTALPPPVDASTHDLQPPVDSHLDLVDARLLSDDISIIAHTVAPTGGGAGCEADRTGGDLPQLTLYAVLPPPLRGRSRIRFSMLPVMPKPPCAEAIAKQAHFQATEVLHRTPLTYDLFDSSNAVADKARALLSRYSDCGQSRAV